MKILFLSSELVPERAGGIAAYTATIAPALAARGHDVHVLSCAPEHAHRDDHESGVWWHRRRLAGGERTPSLGRFRQSALRLATAASCRRELARLHMSFDVIESPEWLAESLLLRGKARAPVVVSLHTPLHVLFAFDVGRFHRDLRIADRLERAAVRRATAVTSSSSLLADTLFADGWLRTNPRIIPLPVDLDTWSSVPPVPGTEREILVVGRLEPRKAPEVAVEAAAMLAEDIPGVHMTFVGRSRGWRERLPYGEWTAALAERTGAPARFVPQLPHHEMHEHYANARVVAVPSRFESFSVAATEAMACARPVVYTSNVGVGEVLRGTDAGTEVPVDDARALANALKPYLLDSDHAARAGATGREIARLRCGPDIIAEQRERCFDDALAAHRKGRECSPTR